MKCQVTIPAEIREKAGLLPGKLDGEAIRLVKVNAPRSGETRGGRIVGRMWRRSRGRMSTDEIMALMRGDWRDVDGGCR